MVSLTGSEGCAVTTYGDQAIGPLKKRLKEAINSLAESLDAETRQVHSLKSWAEFGLDNQT
jgi:hypothetical protein